MNLCTVHGVAPHPGCDGCYPPRGNTSPADEAHKILLGQLVEDIAAGVRVLRTRDGLPVSEFQVMDRARNIVAGLVGNYRIEAP